MSLPRPVVRTAVRLAARWTTDPRHPFEVQRRRYARVAAGSPPPRGTAVERIEVAGVPVERVAAVGASEDHVILHLHGGGLCIGSAATHRGFAARLSAATQAVVVVPDYRLAPEHPCPAAADDAYAVWSAVAGEHAVATLSGDSAGGGLALLTAVRARDRGGVPPSALVLLSPFVDLAADHAADADLVARDIVLSPDWLTRCALSYASGRPLDDPDVSPIHHDLRGLAPTFVVLGSDEVLAPEGERLVAAARRAGVDVELLRGDGLWHIYPTQAGMLTAADDALAAVAAFLHTRCVAPSLRAVRSTW